MTAAFYISLVHILVYGLILASGYYGPSDLLMILNTQILVGVTTYLSFRALSGRKSGLSALALGPILLFYMAYVIKMPIVLYFPAEFWVVPKLVNEATLRDMLPFAFLVGGIGYIALLLSILTVSFVRPIDWTLSSLRPRYSLLITLSILAIVIKYVLKDKFSLGVPNVEPVYLGLPLLTGLVTLIIDVGFLVLVNLLLFAGFGSQRVWLLIIGILVAFGNSGVELAFGAKDALMYQLVITLAYAYIFWRHAPQESWRRVRKNVKIALGFTLVIGTFVLVAYKFFNFLRYARQLNISNIFDIIQWASQNQTALGRSSFMELYNRLSGIEVLSAVVAQSDIFPKHFTLSAMWDGSITKSFTATYLDGIQATTMFGTTQFGYFFAAGGFLGLILGMIVLGRIFIFMQNALTIQKITNRTLIASLPILWVLIAQTLLGGGNLVLVSKSFLILIIFSLLVSKLLFRRVSQTRPPAADWNDQTKPRRHSLKLLKELKFNAR